MSPEDGMFRPSLADTNRSRIAWSTLSGMPVRGPSSTRAVVSYTTTGRLSNIAAAAQVAQRQSSAQQRDNQKCAQAFEPFGIELLLRHQSRR